MRANIFIVVMLLCVPIAEIQPTSPPGFAHDATEAAPPANAVRLSGYLPDYELGRFDPTLVGKFDELIFFSIEPRTDGRLDTSRAPAPVLTKLREMRGNQATKLWIAVGGGNRSDNFAEMALDDKSRDRFIAALRQFCVDNHFAGADFDWEFPAGKAELAAYNQLLVDCKRCFEPCRLELSVAVVTSQQFSRDVYAAVDRFRLMSYDHDGPEHSSVVQARADIKLLVDRGISRQNISLGVPFYGRTADGKALAWRQIVARFHPASDVDIAGAFSFNGPRTIEQKARLVNDEKLGGLMIWEIGQDVPLSDPSSLLTAAVKGLR